MLCYRGRTSDKRTPSGSCTPFNLRATHYDLFIFGIKLAPSKCYHCASSLGTYFGLHTYYIFFPPTSKCFYRNRLNYLLSAPLKFNFRKALRQCSYLVRLQRATKPGKPKATHDDTNQLKLKVDTLTSVFDDRSAAPCVPRYLFELVYF